MPDTRTVVRRIVLGGASVVLVVAIYPLISEFLIELAKERGFYDHPSETVEQVSAVAAAIVASSWFHWIGGLIVGAAVGLWADTLMRRGNPNRLPAGLYVGDMNVNLCQLEKEKFVEISMRIFNGTGVKLKLGGISGGAVYFERMNDGNARRIANLPAASILPMEGRPDFIEPLSDYLVSIYQRFPSDIVERFISIINSGGSVMLDFDGINLYTTDRKRKTLWRAPIWNGISISRPLGGYVQSRVVAASGLIEIAVAADG